MASDKAPVYERRGVIAALAGAGAALLGLCAWSGLAVWRNLWPQVSYGEDFADVVEFVMQINNVEFQQRAKETR